MMHPERGIAAALLSILAVACGDDTTTGTTGGDGGAASTTTSTTASTTATTATGAGGDGVGGSGTTSGGGGDGGGDGTGGGGGEGGGTFAPADTIALEPVVTGLVSPLVVHRMPDGTGRLAIAEQTGVIRVADEDGVLRAEPLVDLSSRLVTLDPAYDERGLLGFAFHPDFPDTGRMYVFYSAPLRPGGPAGYDHTNVISELTLDPQNLDVVDLASERILLQIDQPQFNHNAGQITFGPDGYLYIPIGDGGGGNDVGLGHVEDWYVKNAGGNGQDIQQNLLGSILRIDVDGDPYGIPPDNPYADGIGGLPEVWAFGFRNPYRISFDVGGVLYGSDAGQELWEEISIIEAGGNHGWNVKEGTHCFDTALPATSLAECPTVDFRGVPFVDPILEYPNAKQPGGLGFVVIGGHVYRGSNPGLAGNYVFGDATRDLENLDGSLFAAAPPQDVNEKWQMRELSIFARPEGRLGEMVKSFGQDDDGELFVLTSEALGPAGTTGKVYRITAAPVSPAR